jgi:hypothetical protein
MPIDLLVEYTDGTMESFIFRCARCYEKRMPAVKEPFKRLTWAASNYDFTIGKAKAQSKSPSIQAD